MIKVLILSTIRAAKQWLALTGNCSAAATLCLVSRRTPSLLHLVWTRHSLPPCVYVLMRRTTRKAASSKTGLDMAAPVREQFSWTSFLSTSRSNRWSILHIFQGHLVSRNMNIEQPNYKSWSIKAGLDYRVKVLIARLFRFKD